MRPYLGILIDSFWEAVSNKVLWALLLGWSVILLALAPFGYISSRSFQLSAVDVSNRAPLVDKLTKGVQGRGSASVKAVASKLEPEFAERLLEAKREEENRRSRIRSSELADALNVVLKTPGLYSEEAFPTAKRRDRLEPLIESSSLAEDELEQLNRELLQLAFPLELRSPSGEQLWIGYGGFKIGSPLGIGRRQIRQFLEPIFLGIVIKLGLAFLTVLVAIIVTSPIIPDTFRSGSLHLLLSKPISRILLYLSKFFGGCSFALLNITYVLVGLYLIAGIRFEIWNHGLLACIPLLLFVFIIFYSISGLAGVVWQNTIVCVVACMVFWFGCFAVGLIHDIIMPHARIMPQIRRVQQIHDHVTVVNESGDFDVWNEEFSVWQTGINSEFGGQAKTFGPVYDASQRKILVKSFLRQPFGPPVARTRKLSVINVGENEVDEEAPLESGEASQLEEENAEDLAADDETTDDAQKGKPANIDEARRKPRWSSDLGPELPSQAFDLLKMGDTIVAVCRGGIFELDMEQLQAVEAGEDSMLGMFNLSWLNNSAFQNIAPNDYYLSQNSNTAVLADGSGLIVYSSGKLDRLEYKNDKLEVVTSGELEGDVAAAALVQMNNAFCVVARDNLPVEILDTNLSPITSVELPSKANAKQLSWIPNTNSLAIVTHTGELLRLDCDSGTIELFDLPHNRACSCIDWADAQHCFLGVQPNAVYKIDIDSGQVVASYVPQPRTLDRIYNLIISPIYTIAPKPAALDNAMGYLLSGSETQSMSIVTNDLGAAQVELDVWTPIVSNLLFVAAILAITCIYVWRKEF